MNRTGCYLLSRHHYWFKIILYWSSYWMELPPMKSCESFERHLDQLRMGARQNRKKPGSHQSRLEWTIWDLSRDASIFPVQQPWDSAAVTWSATRLPHWQCRCRQWLTRSDIPRIVKLMLYAVNDDNTDQDVIIKSPRHFQDFDSVLYDAQFG